MPGPRTAVGSHQSVQQSPDTYQPQHRDEYDLVTEAAYAKWRQHRMWLAETAQIEVAIALNESELRKELPAADHAAQLANRCILRDRLPQTLKANQPVFPVVGDILGLAQNVLPVPTGTRAPRCARRMRPSSGKGRDKLSYSKLRRRKRGAAEAMGIKMFLNPVSWGHREMAIQ